jgi:hypothetical protein
MQLRESHLALWSEEEKEWAASFHESPGFRAGRERYVEIGKRLSGLRPRSERSALVDEIFDLRYW